MKYLLMGLIRVYQWTLSPLLGPICRYYPSCSHYGYEAMRTHGACKGTCLTAWRILRCNPWSAGGVDHVPPRTSPPWFRRLRDILSRMRGRKPSPPGTSSSEGSETLVPSRSCPDHAVGRIESHPATSPNAQGA